MRFTRWARFGILCCLYMARKSDSDVTSASEIAEANNIPINYTQQILLRLRKGDVIESVRGPTGGFKLRRAPEKTTLREILSAAEGDTFEMICYTDPLFPECNAEDSKCSIRIMWEGLTAVMDDYLEKQTLASLIQTCHGFSEGTCFSKNLACCRKPPAQ